MNQPVQAAAALPSSAFKPASSSDTAPQTGALRSIPPQPAPRIEALWIRLAAIYGHRFTSSFGEDPNGVGGQTWAQGLAGLTPQDLAAGVEACIVARTDGWPPTLSEFRAMCLGIPTYRQVEVQVRTSSLTPFGRLVWQYLDTYGFTHSDTRTASRMLEAAYETARELVMQGHPLPEPSLALAQELRGFQPADRAHVTGLFEDLARHFGIRVDDGEKPLESDSPRAHARFVDGLAPDEGFGV